MELFFSSTKQLSFLAIGARSREGYVLLIAVADQVVVEELRAVVGVDAQERDGEALSGALEA
jgi:hypothetical protein